MKKLFLICLLVLISFSFTTIKEPPPSPKSNNHPPGTPIDGGLSILLIAATTYGVYKLRKK